MPGPTTTGATPPKSNWRRYPVAALWAVVIVVCLFTIAGFGARYWWRCEQLCHFRLQYFWLLTTSTVVFWVYRQWPRAVIAGLLAAVNAATIVPLYVPESSVPDNSIAAKTRVPLRIMTFNVHSSNRRYDDVLACVRDKRPDVAVLLEVSPEWSNALRTLTPEYPYQHVVPRLDSFGMAIVSRLPWTGVDSIAIGPADLPSVVAHFQTGDAAWTIVGTHPLPPVSPSAAAARNEHLSALAMFVRCENAPVVVAGDLNVTSWSPYFRDLLRDGTLRDSRQGRGVQPSWVSRIPLTDLPIDHILVSPGIVVASRIVGPHLGSDHRPVIADLLLPKQ